MLDWSITHISVLPAGASALLIPVHSHSDIAMYEFIRHVCALSRKSVVELELSNFYFKERNQGVVSLLHDADVTPGELFEIGTILELIL